MSNDDQTDVGATPEYPYDSVLLSQRDLGLRVPINYVTVPGVSLSAACFPRQTFEDEDAGDCLSNLLAVGFRRLTIDVYWDEGRHLWSFCPVAIPPTLTAGVPEETSTSSLVSSTSFALASAASFFSSGDLNARRVTAQPISTISSDTSSSSGSLSQVSATSNANSAFPSSLGPDPPLASFIPDANDDLLVSVPPFVCTTTINLPTFTSQIYDYIEITQKDILAHFFYVIINIHAAASATDPLSPAPSPKSLPQLSENLGPLFLANLSSNLYTPGDLRSDRANLNESWYKVDSLHRPVDGYYSTHSSQHEIFSTEDGWPTEHYLLLQLVPNKRVMLGWGTVDPQMSNYNFSGDQGTIFPNGYIQDIETNIDASTSGDLTKGCFFRDNHETASQVNSSWANDANISGFSYPTSATSDIIPLLNLTTNTTNCGISPNLNVTLLNATAHDDPTAYKNYTMATTWSWAPGQPKTHTSDDDSSSDDLFRCATFNIDLAGRWTVSDCSQKNYVACQDPKSPYNWTTSTYPVSYSYAPQACPDRYSFAAPRTALENSYLTQAIRNDRRDYDGHGVFVDFNSLDIADCWVQGGPNATCPYTGNSPTEDYKRRTVLVPSIAAVIVLIVTALTVGVKAAGNRKVRKRTNKRVRANNGFIYEGVPS